MAQIVVQSLLGLGIAVASILFWALVVWRGEGGFRNWVARRFQVTIERGPRGHWKVTSGPGSAGRHFLIELLQLVYFMTAFAVWALGVLLAVGALALVQRWL